MTVSASSQKAQSAFQREFEEFRKQFARVVNCGLNKVFDLTVKGSQRRNQMLRILFVLAGVFFVFRAHSLDEWLLRLGELFSFLLDPNYAINNPTTPTLFINFVLSAFTKPQTYRYLPVFILPFLLALQSAAIYLADIFELSDVKIARDFIRQVALGGASEGLHIKNGEVVEKDKVSPVYLIGGPGKVTVELDSVALFEKPDGRPHIIDSTNASNHILEGFERFRGAIDLRDQFLELSERENNSVTGRSLDGMPIRATDVRLLYRVRRDKLPPTLERPHPYVKEAVYQLIYNEARVVTLEGMALQKSKDAKDGFRPAPSALQMGAIEALIRAELGKFMLKHKLTRYLASYGKPEHENAVKLEEEIKKISDLVADPSDPVEPEEIKPPPAFESRPKITSLFTEFTNEFPNNARDKGVDLQWIGVGTWKPLDDIIPEKHIEAWRISMENLGRGSDGAIQKLGQDIKTQKKIQLIQDVPISRFQRDRANGMDYDFIVKNLLVCYREQLIKAKELLEESEQPVPEEITQGIAYLDSIMGHWL